MRLFNALAFAAAGVVLLALPARTHAAGPIQSSPIALSADGKLLVNVNPDAGTLSVFSVTAKIVQKTQEIPSGQEPVSVAITPDNKRAFVANTRDGTVATIDLVGNTVTNTFPVGKEPMALALSPSAQRLYVANSAANNLMVLDVTGATPATVTTIDLSGFGTAPRAIASTNDNDKKDDDETIFVAMFFGQRRSGKSFLDEGQDDQREGHVVAISAATNAVVASDPVAVLGPIADTGFNSNGTLLPANGLTPAVTSTNPQTFTKPTGAYPNQLAAIAIHPKNKLAYVVSTGASPNGPLRFNHMAQGLISVFDTLNRAEVVVAQTDPKVRRTAPLNLNQGVNLATTPTPRLFHTNPVAMAWRGNGKDAWVVIQNSNLVVRIDVSKTGAPSIAAPLAAGPSAIVRLDLENPGGTFLPGKAPNGIVIDRAGARAFVSNFISRTVTVLDIKKATAPKIFATLQSSDVPAAGSQEDFVQTGAELFFTGRGPQGRMSSDSWGGCIVCHPNGRSDNVTWMFDAGPRQTIPLDGTFNKSNLADQRILNWSAVRDEVHDFELNTRNVFGGRGLIDDDRLFYVLGGASIFGDAGNVEQFHQATGVVGATNDAAAGAPLPVLPGARRDFATATLPDGRVFIIGGRTGRGQGTLIGAGDAIVEFDSVANAMFPRNSTGFTRRHSLGAAAVKTSQGFRIYAIGGYSSTSVSVPVTTVEEYNPDADTWRTVASLLQATAQFGITVAGGVNTADPVQLIHVVGGNADTESMPVLVSAAFGVQRFQADPAGAGTWANFNVAGLTTRRNHGAAAVQRGAAARIFLIGGQNAAGTVLDTVEEYTNATVPSLVATTHTSINIGGPSAPRAKFGIASSLSTNQIYVIGGVDNTGLSQSTVLEYSTVTNGPVAGPPGTPSGAWLSRGSLGATRTGLGVSLPAGVTNFLPVENALRSFEQESINAWVAEKVRSARAPVAATDADAMAGRTLFGTVGLVIPGFSCATCHGGPKWTRSIVDYLTPPSPADNVGLGNQNVIGAELRKTSTQPGVFPGVLVNVGTFAPNSVGGRVNEIRFNAADVSQAIAPLGASGFNIPSLFSVHETAPYFYNGLAQSLSEVLDGSRDGNGGVRHHFVVNATQRAQLVQFLRSIDGTTPIFP